jgi:hypothetical protein
MEKEPLAGVAHHAAAAWKATGSWNVISGACITAIGDFIDIVDFPQLQHATAGSGGRDDPWPLWLEEMRKQHIQPVGRPKRWQCRTHRLLDSTIWLTDCRWNLASGVA